MFNLSNPATALHRFIGALGVALILLLSVLAVRPDLHEAICHHHDNKAATHADQQGDDEDGCVVTLFAHGHILAAIIIALLLLIAAMRPVAVFPTRVFALASIDYEWPHGCGPPSA